MLPDGTARSSESSWFSALYIVPKKHYSWRPCGDYKAHNTRTIPDRYHVRHIHDYSRQFSGCRFFSKIYLVRAYNYIPVHPSDIQKTAITTHFGLFAWTPEHHKVLEKCKANVSRAMPLADPEPNAQLALVTDTSTTAMRAVSQRVNSAWQALALFSKKVIPTQADVQCLRLETPSCLGGSEIFPPHVGSAPLHHLHGPQTNHLRLPTETRQILTAAIQPPGLHSEVHSIHTTHIRKGQGCRRCAFSGRIRHFATIPRSSGCS
jgi:hypothetical protein